MSSSELEVTDMSFEETNEEFSGELKRTEKLAVGMDSAEEPIGIEEELENIEDDIKAKKVVNHHRLEVRRAIEDHLEKTRLRKELDYLFDDEFTAEKDDILDD